MTTTTNNNNNNNNNYYYYGASPFLLYSVHKQFAAPPPQGGGFFSSPKPTALPKPGIPPYVVKDTSHSWSAVDGASWSERPSKTTIK